MIKGDETHDAHPEGEAVPAAEESAPVDSPALPAATTTASTSSPSAHADSAARPAPVKATVVDAASAAGAAVVPAKAVRVRSKASSVTSLDSSVYQESELVFDFGTYVGGVDPITGLRQGQGTLTYTNGNVYEGEWKQGAPDGIGEKRYKNGDAYRGGWREGQRQGRGGYLFAKGHYFEGMYKDDQANGYGILTTVGGDRYAGHWKDGKKDGKGRETLADGQTFIGHWKSGKKQGRGKLILMGAAGPLFGIWHEDHFFRELTADEMGVDGDADIVDAFGLPRDGEEAAVVPRAGAEAAANPFDLNSISNRLQHQWMTGVSAMEKRLDALSEALEHATAGNESEGPNKPAPGVTPAGPASTASASRQRQQPSSGAPVTATVAGTVENSGPDVDADGIEAFATEPQIPSSALASGHVDPTTLEAAEDAYDANILSTADREEEEEKAEV